MNTEQTEVKIYRHAYLIMAHDQPVQLKKLIRALDDDRNDLYIHIDRKAKNIRKEDLAALCRRSGVFFIPGRNIVWGGESLILCEMDLFRKASEKGYRYYHLISGADFPVMTQDAIHDFFGRHDGSEFIEFWERDKKEYEYRIRYRYPLQERIGRYTNDLPTLVLRVRSKLQVFCQKMKGTDRVRDYGRPVRAGGEWVSVTDDFVRYLLSREEEIREYFLQGVAADELYKQTICWNSPFREKIWPEGHMRLIIWKQDKPYIWQEEDLEEIMRSDKLFVRKVTEENRLADRITERLTS